MWRGLGCGTGALSKLFLSSFLKESSFCMLNKSVFDVAKFPSFSESSKDRNGQERKGEKGENKGIIIAEQSLLKSAIPDPFPDSLQFWEIFCQSCVERCLSHLQVEFVVATKKSDSLGKERSWLKPLQ